MEKDRMKKLALDAIERDPAKDDIRRAALFGSYLHGTANDTSDVDVLIEFRPGATIGFFDLVRLQRRIGGHIGKKIDLLTLESLSKFFKEKVVSEAETIYER